MPLPFTWRLLAASAWALALGACSQNPVKVDLHSLQSSGNVSFVCRADDGSAAGHRLDECPDYEHGSRHLLGLVTQTATDEVAIVDLYTQAVVDVDPATPGYTFLRVGARPGAIVSTPGGAASFVGVTGLQKNGVFALPTTCLSAPSQGQAARDLTTWSACALSSAPGDITVVVDPPAAGSSVTRATCDGGTPATSRQAGRDCPADLDREAGPSGRRKLLVALPEEHKLVLLDAQALLDRNPGEFAPCNLEREYPLDTALPKDALEPVLPEDLKVPSDVAADNACQLTRYPPAASTASTPGGFALSGDRLYVADRTLPVVHVLDVASPCDARELPPLLPHSYLDPGRVVTTSRLAVSPVTPAGKQYVYAVDDSDQPAASVMAFDVSPAGGGRPAASQRTPIVFPGAPRQPYLPPDRLRFSAPVRDVSFVARDFPTPDPTTGVGQFGLACDPYPTTPASAPGALYRPNSDFSDGARPLNLRGVFGFVMLTSGQIAIIDVEDFDASCRRPITTNASSSQAEDFRGCVPDRPAPNQSVLPEYFTIDGGPASAPTVTNESSCHVVETNRPRSAALSLSNTTNGLRAPTLRSFPQFSNPDPSAAIAANNPPRLLAVDFASTDPSNPQPIPAQVNISAQLYVHCPSSKGGGAPSVPCDGNTQFLPLELDPSKAPQNSLVLPLSEPRSYAQDEAPELTFEGRVFADRTSGFLQSSDDPAQALLRDPDANYCGAGVEDNTSILEEAESLAIPAARRKAWAAAHSDYVQVTGDFPAAEDVYWTVGAGQSCGHDACVNEFGTIDNPAALSVGRDLSIVEAYGDHLVVTPRCETVEGKPDPKCVPSVVLKDLRCCFPAGTPYTVRASHQWLLTAAAGLHDLASGEDGRCVHTAACDPRKKYFHSRAFEVCNSDPSADPGQTCKASDPAVGCVVEQADLPIEPGGAGSQCVFENLTSRFVVYRGAQRSARGMSFSWQTTGGFVPLTLSLATQSSQVNPQSMAYLPELGYLAVIDGSTLGLSLFDLNSLGVVSPSPYF